MPYQVSITIKEALGKIQKQQYVLPAIRREFVWSKERIAQVFDGPLRPSPVRSFACWSQKARSSGRTRTTGSSACWPADQGAERTVADRPVVGGGDVEPL